MLHSRSLNRTASVLSRHVAAVQGGYFLISGCWPLVSLSSFLAVTGPKTDVWLVHTVGLLLMVIGLVLVSASLRRRADPLSALLGGGTAAVLIGIEAVYVFRGVIGPIYLADSAVQGCFLLAWLRRLWR
ncbi:MAG TPA: hypothetical protein VLT88_07815 [Desulfosarcina sp.]|nr:hypothetical protein [Desulfosarcina sp.]